MEVPLYVGLQNEEVNMQNADGSMMVKEPVLVELPQFDSNMEVPLSVGLQNEEVNMQNANDSMMVEEDGSEAMVSTTPVTARKKRGKS